MNFVKQRKEQIILLLIIALGAFLRLYGLNWDQGYHLHPDERFLTMVGNAMHTPNSLYDYFNPQISTFNPTNVGFSFFVYGIFPLTLNKILAVFFSNDSYNSFTLQGRFLSALFDVLTALLVYKTTELFERKYNLNSSVKYWASFFYAIAVLPIQLSHFFAVDTFLNFFMFTSFYFALRYWIKSELVHLVLSGVFFGLALASKISAIFILPLNLFFVIIGAVHFKRSYPKKDRIVFLLRKVLSGILLSLLYLFMFYLILRLVNPYYFETDNFLNPQVNSVFLQNIKTLKSVEGQESWYPPVVQWIHKPPITFSLINLAVFGIGIPYFIFVILGFYFAFKRIKKVYFFAIFMWVIGFFLYQSIQFVKAIRYFIFLYPFLAIFAGIGFYYITHKITSVFRMGILLLILLWPVMFISIYSQKHSRVVASEWMYQNLKDKSVILAEHWDDALPVYTLNTYGKSFMVELLPVFGPDTPEKWQEMYDMLERADYLVLSSNRGWGSIPTVPEKYPLMSKFYLDLFAGLLTYKKINEFTSYPSLKFLGIPIEFADDWADEPFTVYDHPKVIIFKNALKSLQ